MRQLELLTLSALLILASGGLADGDIVVTKDRVLDETFSVASGDLFETSVIDLPVAEVIVDGQFGAVGTDSSSRQYLSNMSLVFGLDLAASPLGYEIDQINTYAGWDEGRDGQEYTVFYSLIDAPQNFIQLQYVSQFPDGEQFGGEDSSTRIQIYDDQGQPLLTNVAALRFDFTSFENSGTAYRELDVLGRVVSVPEPALGLPIAIVGCCVSIRRRRS